MKYKEQALTKIEKIESQLRALEISINRGGTVEAVMNTIGTIKALVENLRSNITIENDEWVN